MCGITCTGTTCSDTAGTCAEEMKNTQDSDDPKVCNVGSIANAQCHEGVCRCNEDYYANESDGMILFLIHWLK